MTDLVERLRNQADSEGYPTACPSSLLHQAADEIERLREALQRIVDFSPDPADMPALNNENCEGCQRARENRWPPSLLCDKHYRIMASYENDRRHTQNVQHLSLRRIAREALAAKEGEGQ